MVALYVAGSLVGTLADAEKLLTEFAAQQTEVELRDDAGKVIGRFVPAEPICPWKPGLTRAELNRTSAAGGGITLAEFWKRMGVA